MACGFETSFVCEVLGLDDRVGLTGVVLGLAGELALAREVGVADLGGIVEAPRVEGVSTDRAPAPGVSDGAVPFFCPKVVVGAVAAGGGEGVEVVPRSRPDDVAVPLGDVGWGVAETWAAALDPADAPLPFPWTGGDTGPPPPGADPDGAEGGRALWPWVGRVVPGSRINDAATTPAAAAAATPMTGRRR